MSRKRRWLLAIISLIAVAALFWAFTPEIDSRFIGTWEMVGVPGVTAVWDFSKSGFVTLAIDGELHQERALWRVRESRLVLGHQSDTMLRPVFRKIGDLYGAATGNFLAIDDKVAYEILEIQQDVIRLGALDANGVRSADGDISLVRSNRDEVSRAALRGVDETFVE
jgi:hypothetical protein